jgi:protein-tyrosine-phosphatase
VMEAAQLHEMQQAYPEYRERMFVLALYDEGARGACERYNIADPFGRPPSEFDACYARIERALHRWVAEVPSPGELSVNRR